MPPGPKDNRALLSLEVEERIDAVCVPFEKCWKSGATPLLEQYLEGIESDRDSLLRELLAIDVHYRRLRGDNPTVQTYLQHFPEQEVLIREALRQVIDQESTRPYPLPSSLQSTSPQPPTSRSWPMAEEAIPAELRDHPRYQVLRRLGAGGMGVVYLCQHRLMRHNVALKVIKKKLIKAPALIERFQREMRVAALLDHPNLVRAFDADQTGELHFLVLEFIAGITLEMLVRREGRLAVQQACDYVRQAALGLAHAATQGLVHRDIKPQNIMVTPQGQVKVMDFGLASVSAELGGVRGLTEQGEWFGTPDYIAPEQIRDARAADARADLYSLGCTLYFLLTGQEPFPTGNSAQKLAAHLEQQPEKLSVLRPELPTELVQVIEKIMAKNPERRYQTAAAVAAALEPWSRPLQPRVRPGVLPVRRGLFGYRRSIVIAGVAALLLVAVALTYFFLPWSPRSNGSPSPLQPGDPAPDLTKVMPLIDDDFSSPARSQFVTHENKTNGDDFRHENGRYSIRKPQNPNGYTRIGTYRAVEGDFACQVVGHTQPGNGTGWGLSLGTDGDRHLGIKVGNDGAVEVGTFFLGDAMDPIVKPIHLPTIQPADKPITLLIILQASQWLEIFINGTAISEPIHLKQPLAPRVEMGLLSWNQHTEFTRFTLWLLPPPQSEEEKTAPDLSKIEPLVEYDFRRGIGKFGQDLNVNYGWFFEKDHLVMHASGQRKPANPKLSTLVGSLVAAPLGPIEGDLACQAVGRILTEGDSGWAIDLRSPKEDGDVATLVRQDGCVEVGNLHWEDGAPSRVTLVGPIQEPNMHLGNEPNTLLVILRGGQTLEIYVNGIGLCRPIHLREKFDSVAPRLALWVRRGHSELNARVEFTQFTVWRLPPAQAKP